MRRLALASLVHAILIVPTFAATAAPLDDAKKSIAAADKEVVASGATLGTLGKSLAQHLTTLADVVRQLDAIRDRQTQAAPIIAKALDAANANVATAQAEAAAAQRSLRDAEAALAAAQADVAPKRAAIERAASDERKAFESSDVFKDASSKVAAAGAALAKERARLDASMSSNPTLVPLAAASSKAEADLTAARSKSPPDDAATAEASSRWIDGKNALTKAQSDVYAADANFVSAQKAAAAATAARTALSDAFDKSILTQPGVAEAQLAFRDAQGAVKVAQANVDAARDAVERAGRWLIAQRSNVDVIGRIAFDADAAIVAAEADLKRAQLAVRGIARELAAATANVLGVRDELKAAADAVNAAGKK